MAFIPFNRLKSFGGEVYENLGIVCFNSLNDLNNDKIFSDSLESNSDNSLRKQANDDDSETNDEASLAKRSASDYPFIKILYRPRQPFRASGSIKNDKKKTFFIPKLLMRN